MSASLEKALTLIEAMARAREPSSVTQLARDLNLNKSTVYRLLEVLCQHGYARQHEVARSYMLTTRMWELGVEVLRKLTVHNVAPDFMRACAENTGETLLLAIPDNAHALVIAKAESSHPLQIFSSIGTRLPLHVSSVGKVLMFDWSDDDIRDYAHSRAHAVTERTITDPETLLKEVRIARGHGYAVSMDEWTEGVSGVAAAVRDASGGIVAALGITGPTMRLHPDRVAPLGHEAVAVAGRISHVLGHDGAPSPAA